MHHTTTDKELREMLERLRHSLGSFPEGMNSLDIEFESAAKHIPAYLKIVKGHIEQLAVVLGLETHNNRKLESVGLAEPVIQLMQLFRELDDKDIQLIESLAYEARNWVHSEITEPVKAVETA